MYLKISFWKYYKDEPDEAGPPIKGDPLQAWYAEDNKANPIAFTYKYK